MNSFSYFEDVVEPKLFLLRAPCCLRVGGFSLAFLSHSFPSLNSPLWFSWCSQIKAITPISEVTTNMSFSACLADILTLVTKTGNGASLGSSDLVCDTYYCCLHGVLYLMCIIFMFPK